MKFETAHQAFINKHVEQRTGERRGRLLRGHGHGETLFLKNVWWPLYGHFENLHPEYEVLDWRRRSYFGDFAYLPKGLKLIIEIKGYGPHVQDMDRQKYCDELNRELFLQIAGFRVISFAYDDIAHRPEQCIWLLRMLLSRYHPSHKSTNLLSLAEQEIIQFAITRTKPIRPADVIQHLDINYRTDINVLRSLVDQGKLQAVYSGNGARIRYYKLSERLEFYEL